MAVPLFTVLLNNVTFFFFKFNYGVNGSRSKIVILLYDASTAFNVASSPVFAMQAFCDVRPKPGAYYTQEVIFSS